MSASAVSVVDALFAPPGDPEERLLWTLMRRFEALALERYAAHVPALATTAKSRFIEDLRVIAPDDAPLRASALAAPMEAVFESAQSADETAALLVQGLVLERLGQAIYRIAEGSDLVTPASRAVAAAGRTASEEITALAARRIAEHLGTGDALYAVFTEVSHDVLAALDGIGDPVDAVFGERFGLSFAELMGEFTAELVGACVELGMQRRKVVAHLAGACMGL